MYRYLALGMMLVALPGCDALVDVFPFLVNTPANTNTNANANDNTDPDDTSPAETGSPELKAFASEEEVVTYFGDQVNSRNSSLDSIADGAARDDDEALDATPSPTAPGAEEVTADSDDSFNQGASNGGGESGKDDSYSGTTVQEEGVDEADVVKIDGTYAYIIGWGTLKIAQIDPIESLAEISQTELEGTGSDIYLYDNKIIALTSIGGSYVYVGDEEPDAVAIEEEELQRDEDDEANAVSVDLVGDDVDDIKPVEDVDVAPEPAIDPYYSMYRYERPQSVVTVLDVTDPASPTLLSKTAIEGSVSSSRMIDGVLHLIVTNYQSYYYDYWPMLGTGDFEVTEDDLAIEDLLPVYTRIDGQGAETSGNVLTWQDLYRPTDPDGFGVVTVVSMDINADAAFTAKGIVAEPGLIYSSLDALYLTDTNWDVWGTDRETTDIYKFVYENAGARPVAAGTVRGRILNQYSMGEYDGYLRVATTAGRNWGWTDEEMESANAVYVLGNVEGTLEVVGSVTGIAPGEEIKSARFMGTRGYVVTFEEIDPLFTLDLSTPTDPKLVGELKVPGFSTFIVPMDENHLLTVGQHIPSEDQWWGGWGVQLSIFDVTDFANPTLKFSEVIGEEGGAYSEAMYNPKAFTYFAEQNLLALPVSIYSYYGGVMMDEGVAVEDVDVDVAEDNVSVSVEEAPEPLAPADPVADKTDRETDGDVVEVAEDEGEGSDEGDSEEGVDEDEVVWVDDSFEGVYVYQVTPDGGFAKLGEISTRFESSDYYYYYWSSFTRGVFVGDNAFAITDTGIRGGNVDALDGDLMEMMFASETAEYPWYGGLVDDDFNEDDDDAAVSGGSDGEVGVVTVVDR